MKQSEIDKLLRERERCQNELQKLKDIIGYAATPNEYKNRQSFLPDCGPVYETVRELQAAMVKLQEAPAPISEEGGGTGSAELTQKLQEMAAAHEVEKMELRQ